MQIYFTAKNINHSKKKTIEMLEKLWNDYIAVEENSVHELNQIFYQKLK